MAKKSKPGKETPPQAVVAMLERLAVLLRSAQHAGGLNPAQWSALRYLARANRFSNTVSGIARYVGATRGTTSQTVQSLERKGLIVRAVREADNRSASLELTDAGRAMLARDPMLSVEQNYAALGSRSRRRFAKGLARFSKAETQRIGVPAFGTCGTCTHLLAPDDGRPAPACRLKAEPLTAADLTRLCDVFAPDSD